MFLQSQFPPPQLQFPQGMPLPPQMPPQLFQPQAMPPQMQFPAQTIPPQMQFGPQAVTTQPQYVQGNGSKPALTQYLTQIFDYKP